MSTIEAVSSGSTRKRKPSKPRAVAHRAKASAVSSDAAGLVPQQAIPGAPTVDLAHQVRGVIRSFHSSVASPLASIGLQLELLRTDPSIGPAASAELKRITSGLDDIIDVVRASNRQLRRLEQQILSQEEGPRPVAD